MIEGQQGIALLVVLWVMTMLTVIVGQFCYSMRSEINITRNFRDNAKAYYQAKAGVQQALFQRLGSDEKKSGEEELDSAVVWRINVENPPVIFGDGSFKVRIGNVSGLININLADKELLALLFGRLEIDEKELEIIVDSIQDWRDVDHFHRIHGAENDYYQNLPTSYSSHDGPFRSVEELLLVRGMTKEILADIRGQITTFPKGTAEKSKPKKKKAKKNNIVSMVQKKININAAPSGVLALFPFMTDIAIQGILDFRRDADFQTVAEVREVVGGDIYPLLSRYITLENSTYYTFTSTGQVADSRAEYTVFAMVDIDADHNEYRYVKWLDSVSDF